MAPAHEFHRPRRPARTSYRLNWSALTLKHRLVLLGLGVAVVLSVLDVARPDVRLHLGRGEVVGWVTLDSKYARPSAGARALFFLLQCCFNSGDSYTQDLDSRRLHYVRVVQAVSPPDFQVNLGAMQKRAARRFNDLAFRLSMDEASRRHSCPGGLRWNVAGREVDLFKFYPAPVYGPGKKCERPPILCRLKYAGLFDHTVYDFELVLPSAQEQ